MADSDPIPSPEDTPEASSPASSETTGAGTVAGFDRFAHFVIQRRPDGELDSLGGGGMGITYRAYDTQLERQVALKLINPQRVTDREVRGRFLREARAAGRLQHPNIASVLYQGEEKSHCFYVMELVSGEDLHHYIDRVGPLAPVHALRIAHQIALAITAAWQEGILHRDLKPGNIMLTVYHEGGAPHAKVIDFGLAKLMTDVGASFLTGGFLGTPEFASPEQCEEEALDVRSDLYSLGVTLWFMLTGSPPFTGSLLGIVRAQVSSPVPIEQLNQGPPALRDLLVRLMAKNPDDRPSTPLEAANEIEAAIETLRGDPQNFHPLGSGPDPEVGMVQTHLPTPFVPAVEAPSARRISKLGIALGSLFLVVAASAAAYWVRHSAAKAKPAVSATTATSATPAISAISTVTPPASAEATPQPAPSAPVAPSASPESTQEVRQPGTLALGTTPVITIPSEAFPPEPIVPMETPMPVPAESPAAVAPVPSLPAAPAVNSTVFTNSLGMRFVEVPIAAVWISVWETRVQDVRAWVRASNFRPGTTGIRSWQTPGFMQSETHPAVFISWDEAEKFCEWLTAKEVRAGLLKQGERYRLPHRREWDLSSGLLRGEPGGAAPQPPEPPAAGGGQRGAALNPAASLWIKAQMPPAGGPPPRGTLLWLGEAWPPPPGTLNAADRSAVAARSVPEAIPGYDDRFPYSAPVGSFAPNPLGVYDLAGNVWEFAGDGPPGQHGTPGKQGGSWRSTAKADFQVHGLTRIRASDRDQDLGFRCVLDRGGTEK